MNEDGGIDVDQLCVVHLLLEIKGKIATMLGVVGYATVYLPFYSEAGIKRREEVRQQKTATRDAKLGGGGIQVRAPSSGSMWTNIENKNTANQQSKASKD